MMLKFPPAARSVISFMPSGPALITTGVDTATLLKPIPSQCDTKTGGTARQLVHAHQGNAHIVVASLKHSNGIRTVRGKTVTERAVRSGTPRPNVPVRI